MRSRVLWRRSATALGVYAATALGFLSTVVATRELGASDYARFAAVFATATFFQLLLDLTVEDALVKYGFRYTEARRFGRLRRIFRVALVLKVAGGVLAGLVIAVLAPLAGSFWGTSGVTVPLLVVALLPLVQSPESVASSAIILRGRYDVRGFFLALSMGLRLLGIWVGALHGVAGAVVGLVVAQALATAAISVVGVIAFRRFPRVPAEPLGDDRRELRRFVLTSSASTSLDSGRATLGAALVPAVSPIEQAGYFRNALAPATAFAALSAPARLVLLTDQTRDFEAGRHELVYRVLNRYMLTTSTAMLVAVPVLWLAMPWLMGVAYGPEFRENASTAARLVLLAGALQLVWAWTKPFPISIGRPGLRLAGLAVEVAVFIPLLLVLASHWGATGAAAAFLCSTVVFCILWVVLLIRIRNDRSRSEALAT